MARPEEITDTMLSLNPSTNFGTFSGVLLTVTGCLICIKWLNSRQQVSEASKKLYALRLLKRAGVQEQDMLKVFRSSVRLISEYAVQV